MMTWAKPDHPNIQWSKTPFTSWFYEVPVAYVRLCRIAGKLDVPQWQADTAAQLIAAARQCPIAEAWDRLATAYEHQLKPRTLQWLGLEFPGYSEASLRNLVLDHMQKDLAGAFHDRTTGQVVVPVLKGTLVSED